MVRPIDLQDNFSKAPGASKAQQHIVDQSRTAAAEEDSRAEMNPGDSGKDQKKKRKATKAQEKTELPGVTGPPKGDDSTQIDVVA